MPDFHDPDDPLIRNLYEPYARSSGSVSGWIAAAVFLLIVLGIAFNVRHEPSRFASNETAPLLATHGFPLAPPAGTIPARPTGPGVAPAPAFVPVAPAQH